MSLQVTQLRLHRPGRAAHWLAMEIACPHGRADGEISAPGADAMTAGALAAEAVKATHNLMHDVMRLHRAKASCRCAVALAIFCWPRVTGMRQSAYVASQSRN